MVTEIEYYKGDTLLYGANVSFAEFQDQMETVEELYDQKEDNFVTLLCRMYGWNVTEDRVKPEYTYDRDVKKCINYNEVKGK